MRLTRATHAADSPCPQRRIPKDAYCVEYCPGDEWPVGYYLKRTVVEENIHFGLFPCGTRIRWQGGVITIVCFSPADEHGAFLYTIGAHCVESGCTRPRHITAHGKEFTRCREHLAAHQRARYYADVDASRSAARHRKARRVAQYA